MRWVERAGAGDGSCAQSSAFPAGKPSVTRTRVVGLVGGEEKRPRSRLRWLLGGSLQLRETPPACEEQR